MKRFEREYLPGMVKILQKAYKGAARALKDGRIEAYLSDMNMMPTLGKYLTDMYVDVAAFYATKTLREINESAREDKADDTWLAAIIEYLRGQLLSKAVLPIRQTTVEDVRRILQKGVDEGQSIDSMVYSLDHSELPVSRARVIIRTELLAAQFGGRKLGEEASEWETNKRWIATKDDRTRHSHAEMDDQVVRSEEKFYVRRRKGGYDVMEGPGDPEGSAENVIQCRCTLSYRAARDENGRLIRKRKISVILPQEVRRRQSQQVVTV